MTNFSNRIASSLGIAVCALTALALLLTTATVAFADPRLVRVIWDVGQGHVYYRADARTDLGHEKFRVPVDATAAEAAGFDRVLEAARTAFLRKGDRVRVYVVNFNPVAHVWHESSALEQVALAPSPGGALLNAALLAITGAGKPLSVSWLSRGGEDPPMACGPSVRELRTAVSAFAKAAADVHELALKTLDMPVVKQLAIDAKTLTDLPRSARQWNEFDNAKAWAAINDELRGDFDLKYEALAGEIKKVNVRIDASNKSQLDLDLRAAKIDIAGLSEACVETAKGALEQRDNLVALLEETVGPGTPFAELRSRMQAAATSWAEYKRKLAAPNWTAEAVEVPLKDAIQTEVVLRIDGVFVSPDKNVTERQYRSVVLSVAPHWPTLIISSGVGFNGFEFKKLQMIKTPTTAEDGAVAARNVFEIVPDTTIERIVPIWIQSVRVWTPSEHVGLYASFGTTPDRNIFRNGIAGVSAHIRRWRTTITYGALMFRGYEGSDLEPVIAEYSDASGFVLGDVTAANVKLPRIQRHYSHYLSFSFTLASF